MALNYDTLTDGQIRAQLLERGYDVPISLNREFLLKKLKSLTDDNSKRSPATRRKTIANSGGNTSSGRLNSSLGFQPEENGESNGHNSPAASAKGKRQSLNESVLRKRTTKKPPSVNASPAGKRFSLSRTAATFSKIGRNNVSSISADEEDDDVGVENSIAEDEEEVVAPPRGFLSNSGYDMDNSYLTNNDSINEGFAPQLSSTSVRSPQRPSRYESYLNYFRGSETEPGDVLNSSRSRQSTATARARGAPGNYQYKYVNFMPHESTPAPTQKSGSTLWKYMSYLNPINWIPRNRETKNSSMLSRPAPTPASRRINPVSSVSKPTGTFTSATAENTLSKILLWGLFFFLGLIGISYIQITSDRYALSTETAESAFSVIFNAFYTLINYFVLIVIVCGFGYFSFQIIKYFKTEREKFREEMFKTIDQILNILQRQYEASKTEGVDPFIGISHLKDQLYTPIERIAKQKLWDAVVDYISHNESRVREEVQHIAGEEFRVWRWIPNRLSTFVTPAGSADNSMMSPSPAGPSAAPGTTGGAGGGPEKKQNEEDSTKWQGQAFELGDGSPNCIAKIPANCLKVRQMIEKDKVLTEEDKIKVERGILEKCQDAIILHIGLDNATQEGLVYVRCATKEDARKAFLALHGWWFEGKLLSVKFLREERYFTRFPESVNRNNRMTLGLYPSLAGFAK